MLYRDIPGPVYLEFYIAIQAIQTEYNTLYSRELRKGANNNRRHSHS